MRNKKAMSDIVTTLIIIAIGIASVGVVWYVLSNVINTQRTGISSSADCLGASFKIVSADPCSGITTGVSVNVERRTGGSNIAGALVAVSDGSNTVIGNSTGINLLEIKRITTSGGPGVTGINCAKTKTAKVYAMVNSSGKINVCGEATDEYTY